jgi:hypothetical protein
MVNGCYGKLIREIATPLYGHPNRNEYRLRYRAPRLSHDRIESWLRAPCGGYGTPRVFSLRSHEATTSHTTSSSVSRFRFYELLNRPALVLDYKEVRLQLFDNRFLFAHLAVFLHSSWRHLGHRSRECWSKFTWLIDDARSSFIRFICKCTVIRLSRIIIGYEELKRNVVTSIKYIPSIFVVIPRY